jgi:hypothetical protein
LASTLSAFFETIILELQFLNKRYFYEEFPVAKDLEKSLGNRPPPPAKEQAGIGVRPAPPPQLPIKK